MPESWPKTILVSDLVRPGAEFDAGKVERHAALYEGDDRFKKNIECFLVKRASEEKDLAAEYYNRMKRAPYNNYAAGLADLFVGATFRKPPEIVSDSEYWTGLNKNIDGMGGYFETLCRDLEIDQFVHKRAYILVDFPKYSEGQTEDSKDSKYAVFKQLPAETVNNWQYGEDGNLEWVRCYTKETVVVNGWEKPKQIRHVWAFYDRESIVTYEFLQDIGKSLSDDKNLAVKKTESPHSLGCCPVFELRASNRQWLMSRIYDLLVELYNAESDLINYTAKVSHATLILKLTNRTAMPVYVNTLNAVALDVIEDAKYIQPDPAAYVPQNGGIERLKKSCSEVVQTMALTSEAASSDRPVASKTAMDHMPLESLLRSMLIPVMECIERAVCSVKKFRGEGETLDDGKVEISISWPEGFTLDMGDVNGVFGTDSEEKERPVSEYDEVDEDGNGVPDDKILHTTQDSVLNGAQVTAALEIVEKVAIKQLPRESGLGMLKIFFNLNDKQAQAVMGSAGGGFEPADIGDNTNGKTNESGATNGTAEGDIRERDTVAASDTDGRNKNDRGASGKNEKA